MRQSRQVLLHVVHRARPRSIYTYQFMKGHVAYVRVSAVLPRVTVGASRGVTGRRPTRFGHTSFG